jgi:hypothetical protein
MDLKQHQIWILSLGVAVVGGILFFGISAVFAPQNEEGGMYYQEWGYNEDIYPVPAEQTRVIVEEGTVEDILENEVMLSEQEMDAWEDEDVLFEEESFIIE